MIEVKTGPNQTAPVGGEAQADGTALLPVSSIQKRKRYRFSGSAVNAQQWDVTLTGNMTASVAAGVLTIAAGTTTGATATLLSKDTFTIPFRVMFGVSLSQRIANQDFIIEIVSVDPITGQPDGQHTMAWVLNGTTATNGIYRVQADGASNLDSGASTIVTTASYSILELEPFSDEAYFHSRAIDSTAGRSNSYVRHQQIPDPSALYKIRIRAVNGGSAPASNTNFLFQFVSVEDYAEVTAEITAGRGNMVAGQGIAANIIGSVSLASFPAGSSAIGDVGVQYRANATGAASKFHLVSAATANATNIKATAGRVVGYQFANTTASWRFVKLHNVSGVPTAGAAVFTTIGIPPNGYVQFSSEGGIAFSTGIGITTVTGAADADATAVGANDIVGAVFYA